MKKREVLKEMEIDKNYKNITQNFKDEEFLGHFAPRAKRVPFCPTL